MDTILISLAFALIAGLLMSRAAKLVNLPAVTAYLIAGLLIGPFCLGRLNIDGIGFTSLAEVGSFEIISQTALGFIAFAIGNEFRIRDLKVMGRAAITVGILQAVITTAVVDLALVTLHFIFPSVISLSSAITLGAIAAATAPAATLMVVRQYKAEGPLTKLLLMVVAIDDAVGLVLFSVSFGIASALETGAISIVSVLVEPMLEIGCSAVLGVIAGLLLNWLEVYFHSRSKRLALAVAFVLLTVGFSSKTFSIGGVHVGFSLLLVCMITGTVFCNICETSEELMARVERWTAPLNMLFFILSGAELNLTVLSNPLVIMIGVIYIIFRSAGKFGGSYISCTMEHTSKEIRTHLGITLLPQAGVALGMALTAANLSDGAMVRSVVLFSVLIYELVGPTLTKWSLTQAGEIKPEGRKSSREVNQPDSKPAVTLK
ncbi:MAG: cation:proton antiporter [Bullifex sp.]